jgi:hypothetical protein
MKEEYTHKAGFILSCRSLFRQWPHVRDIWTHLHLNGCYARQEQIFWPRTQTAWQRQTSKEATHVLPSGLVTNRTDPKFSPVIASSKFFVISVALMVLKPCKTTEYSQRRFQYGWSLQTAKLRGTVNFFQMFGRVHVFEMRCIRVVFNSHSFRFVLLQICRSRSPSAGEKSHCLIMQ